MKIDKIGRIINVNETDCFLWEIKGKRYYTNIDDHRGFILLSSLLNDTEAENALRKDGLTTIWSEKCT